MAIKINSVTVTPPETTVGQSITITVSAVDVTWEIIKNDFTNWNNVSTELSNWRSVLNYH